MNVIQLFVSARVAEISQTKFRNAAIGVMGDSETQYSSTPLLQHSNSSHPKRFFHEQTLQRQLFFYQALFDLIAVQGLDTPFVGIG